MGLRTAKRQIARARMKALGFGRVNRQMPKEWRRMLDKDAETAQRNAGKRAAIARKRVLRKVSA